MEHCLGYLEGWHYCENVTRVENARRLKLGNASDSSRNPPQWDGLHDSQGHLITDQSMACSTDAERSDPGAAIFGHTDP